MTRTARCLLLLAVIVAWGAALWAADPTLHDPVWSPDGQSILFYGNQTGNFEVYLHDLDSGSTKQLTHSPAYDGNPAWAPDGQRLSFASDRDGDFEIYVIGVDGGGLKKLTDNAARDVAHAWSPDGRHIAFESRRNGNSDLYLLEVATGSERRLTRDPGNDFRPCWSQDGSRIVFQSSRRGSYHLFEVEVDGGNLRQLTSEAGHQVSPACHPRDDSIAFIWHRSTGESSLVVRSASSGWRDLTATFGGNHQSPAWSPDGSHIVFSSSLDKGPRNLFVVNLTDGTVTPLAVSREKPPDASVGNSQPPPSGCRPPEFRQFDFWVGEWELSWPASETTGRKSGRGTNRVELALDKCVLVENFDGTPDIPLRGMSVSTFNRQRGKWQQTWVDNSGGYLDFVGEFKNGQMVLAREATTGDGKKILQRMVWKNIAPDSLDWSWERSEDGGKSWKVMWPIRYVKRLSAPTAAGATAPAECRAPELRVFDFLVGTWRAAHGDGRMQIRKVLGGCAIEERWTGGPTDAILLRTFSAGKWYLSFAAHDLLPQVWEGRQEDRGWRFYRRWRRNAEDVLSRTYWTSLPDGKFVKVVEQSLDDGKTWKLHAYDVYTRERARD